MQLRRRGFNIRRFAICGVNKLGMQLDHNIQISPELGLKFAPEIRFFVDTTFAEADRIDQLLRSDRVKRDLEQDE